MNNCIVFTWPGVWWRTAKLNCRNLLESRSVIFTMLLKRFTTSNYRLDDGIEMIHSWAYREICFASQCSGGDNGSKTYRAPAWEAHEDYYAFPPEQRIAQRRGVVVGEWQSVVAPYIHLRETKTLSVGGVARWLMDQQIASRQLVNSWTCKQLVRLASHFRSRCAT